MTTEPPSGFVASDGERSVWAFECPFCHVTAPRPLLWKEHWFGAQCECGKFTGLEYVNLLPDDVIDGPDLPVLPQRRQRRK